MAETSSRLRELRQHQGWTQAQLADALGVSRQTINAIEAGRFDPSLPLALRMSALFGHPVEHLFWLDHPKTEPPAPAAVGTERPTMPR